MTEDEAKTKWCPQTQFDPQRTPQAFTHHKPASALPVWLGGGSRALMMLVGSNG